MLGCVRTRDKCSRLCLGRWPFQAHLPPITKRGTWWVLLGVRLVVDDYKGVEGAHVAIVGIHSVLLHQWRDLKSWIHCSCRNIRNRVFRLCMPAGYIRDSSVVSKNWGCCRLHEQSWCCFRCRYGEEPWPSRLRPLIYNTRFAYLLSVSLTLPAGPIASTLQHFCNRLYLPQQSWSYKLCLQLGVWRLLRAQHPIRTRKHADYKARLSQMHQLG